MSKTILERLKDLERKNCCCRADIFVDEENLTNVFPPTAKEGDWYVNPNTGIYVFDGTTWISVVSGSGTTDGDKGDIIVSAGGTVWTIDAAAVTLAKQANVASGTIFYRKTAGAGAPEVQTLATLKTDLGVDKVDFITVTQAVDLDAIESRVIDLDASVVLKGSWDASAGTFPGAGVAQAGWSYIVSVAGTVDGVSFALYDRAIAVLDNASTTIFTGNWFHADYTDQVLSVNGSTGAVVLTTNNVADFLNKRYVSDANLVTIGNQSGTNTGDQTTIVGITGTKAQFNAAVSDGDVLFTGDVTQYTDELAQDAVGSMIDGSLTYVDGTPLLQRSALTGAITASAGSNATVLGSFTKAGLDAAISDGNGVYSGDNPTLGTVTTTGNIELGNASDTTLSRSAAGVLAVESVVIPTISSTNTITNKRTQKRVVATTQSATPTINTDNGDIFEIVGLAQAITSMTTNLSGTPVEGEMMQIIIKDNGTARALAWGASFVASTVALPTTTVISTPIAIVFQYRTAAVWTAANAWYCIGVA